MAITALKEFLVNVVMPLVHISFVSCLVLYKNELQNLFSTKIGMKFEDIFCIFLQWQEHSSVDDSVSLLVHPLVGWSTTLVQAETSHLQD